MKLTNKHGIPETFINVLKRPTYSKGKAHLSATQLLNSPKIVALTKKFEDELESDVSDMVWSIFGSAIHGVLEHGKDENHLVEERLHATVDGWRISGAVDLQVVSEDGIAILDYKTTSAWAVMNEKIEWEYQLNIYAWLVETVKNVTVKSVGIVAIIRDWSRREAAKNPDYPQSPIKEIPISLWPHEERERFISERISLHSACEFAMETDEDLPECTPEEMWEKPTVWALKKTGKLRANSLHYTKEDADEALAKAGDGYEIEVRPGERTRCATFCPVNAYCQQWRDYQEAVNGNKD
jgi:RecB family exonuclease